jgi:head-tail adaptor
MFAIPAGKLRHVGDIEQRTEVTDIEHGGKRQVWSALATGVRMQKMPISGRELLSLQAVQSEAKVKWRFWQIDGVDSSSRLVVDGKYYDIVAPPTDIDGEGRYCEVLTKSAGGA